MSLRLLLAILSLYEDDAKNGEYACVEAQIKRVIEAVKEGFIEINCVVDLTLQEETMLCQRAINRKEIEITYKRELSI